MVKTRTKNYRRVLTWFASRWRNHQLKRAEKPHSKSARCKTPDGPATRPETPLAVENGVGNPAAPVRVAPNAGTGKRAWRTPIPHLSRFDRKVEPGLIVLRHQVDAVSQNQNKKAVAESQQRLFNFLSSGEMPWRTVFARQQLAGLGITDDLFAFRIPFDLAAGEHGDEAKVPGDGRVVGGLRGRDGRLA